MKETKDLIWECLEDIDRTFSKDDVHTADRKELEDLIIRLKDKLEIMARNETAWWDMPDDFMVELAQ